MNELAYDILIEQGFSIISHIRKQDEIKKGDYLKSIQCYMHESRSSEEDARNYIKDLIDLTWKKMNRDILRDRSFSKDFRRTSMNLARIVQCMYQHGDGFGIPDRETKDRILSLFFEPIPLS
ncbi:hypothetical protein RND71_033386 [Anisodus tanguticus]|uniref:Terpene synthase metal-binding domain-containing protein n=1 Tax=Anisodus tanguticus TaxID=243964 RepID=A0AAE1UXF7_9SOLA|nr:hypothetical protein RND71_033386 [Anisodus tanguticus]